MRGRNQSGYGRGERASRVRPLGACVLSAEGHVLAILLAHAKALAQARIRQTHDNFAGEQRPGHVRPQGLGHEEVYRRRTEGFLNVSLLWN